MVFGTTVTTTINLIDLNSFIQKLEEVCKVYYYSYTYKIHNNKGNMTYITIKFIPSSCSGLYSNQYNDMIYEIFGN